MDEIHRRCMREFDRGKRDKKTVCAFEIGIELFWELGRTACMSEVSGSGSKIKIQMIRMRVYVWGSGEGVGARPWFVMNENVKARLTRQMKKN